MYRWTRRPTVYHLDAIDGSIKRKGKIRSDPTVTSPCFVISDIEYKPGLAAECERNDTIASTQVFNIPRQRNHTRNMFSSNHMRKSSGVQATIHSTIIIDNCTII